MNGKDLALVKALIKQHEDKCHNNEVVKSKEDYDEDEFEKIIKYLETVLRATKI